TRDLLDQDVQSQTFRAETKAVVHDLGVSRNELIANVQLLPVEGDRLHCPMRVMQDSPAGCLVHPAALDPNKPILDDVDTTDTMAGGNAIRFLQQLHRVESASVQGHGIALLDTDEHL